jgi:membrane protease subunit (stomatin/prohibitin family)
MLVYADVKAGFDLHKLTQDDLLVDGRRARLTLPAPEILSVTLNQERTHVVYYRDSLLMDSDIDLVQQAYQVADDAVRKEAERAGILDQAAALGRAYFENHLRQLGYTDVEVVVR